jgi:hypothetical protein
LRWLYGSTGSRNPKGDDFEKIKKISRHFGIDYFYRKGGLKMVNRYLRITAALVVLGFSQGTKAEDIKNDSGCEVCAGAIHYGSTESNVILGDKIRDKVTRWSWDGQKSVWVDLDGVLVPSALPEDARGYELKISGTRNMILIKSLMDGSQMELIFSPATIDPNDKAASWAPEIFLFGADADTISLQDPLDKAWGKIKKTHIYKWAGEGRDLRKSPGELRKQTLYALKLMGPNPLKMDTAVKQRR